MTSLQWKELLIGQDHAIDEIYPYIQLFESGLAPEGRPVGIFLLLGPTGTGKTKTVETLAQVLHGSEKNLVKINCGEFQMDHEVAKLIGAPPGYLGHRETSPALTQTKLNAVTSEHSNLSVVLFDEIEKSAPSMLRILLGVLDKAQLKLGDNSSVNFERSLIFLTSNLGAKEMQECLCPGFGLEKLAVERSYTQDKMTNIAEIAMRKHFSPEFMNRIDAKITFAPLSRGSMEAILRIHIGELRQHILNRLGPRGCKISISPAAFEWLLDQGTSERYGARELKRVVHKHVVRPLAAMIANGNWDKGQIVNIVCSGNGLELVAARAA